MGGQMDRNNGEGGTIDAALELGSAVKDAVTNPENLKAAAGVVRGLSEKGKTTLTEKMTEAADGLSNLTKEDLTEEKLNAIMGEHGKDGVVQAIKAAGLIGSFTGGPLGVLAVLTGDGISGVLNKIKPKSEAEDPTKKDSSFSLTSLMDAAKTGNIGGFIKDTVMSPLNGIMDTLSSFGGFVKAIPGQIGDTLRGIFSSVMGFANTMVPQLNSAVDNIASNVDGQIQQQPQKPLVNRDAEAVPRKGGLAGVGNIQATYADAASQETRQQDEPKVETTVEPVSSPTLNG
ncbi:MAG: hypothetical protein KTR28_00395 [Micavibrio sp.]|nr:hypothetical protein [Micavibrio sp.]